MSGSGCVGSKNGGGGGGLEALLKAAKFVEEQEKQNTKRQSTVSRPSEKLLDDGNGNSAAQMVAGELMLAATQTTLPFISASSVPSAHNGLPLHSHLLTGCTSTPPPLPRHGSIIREVHNKLEKNRRAHLKECFETLKKQLPLLSEDKKTSNLSILHNAIRYIAVLKRKQREIEHEMERLAREKIAYQQRLSTLKKELTAQWEHIDLNTLVPEIVEPEPRRASELMNGRLESVAGSDEDLLRTSTQCSSSSSLSSASPLHTVEHVNHHSQIVSSPGPPSLLVSPLQQILPSTTIRMLPAETHFVHSHIPTTGITIQNGVLNHSAVTIAAKHSGSNENSALVASSLLNHSLVVPQPSGSFLLAAPSHISDKMVTTAPVLKTIGQVPLQSQFLVKPTMVVVSAATNTSN